MRDTGSRSALGVIHGAAQFKVHSSHLAVGLLFSVAGILACMAPVQSDTWWLLRAGQDIWSTGTVPLADAYSHTAVGRHWWNHEWLTEALFYVLDGRGYDIHDGVKEEWEEGDVEVVD